MIEIMTNGVVVVQSMHMVVNLQDFGLILLPYCFLSSKLLKLIVGCKMLTPAMFIAFITHKSLADEHFHKS